MKKLYILLAVILLSGKLFAQGAAPATGRPAMDGFIMNGTPRMVYKTNIVEYFASDYKLKDNAAVNELLKKMEGMEVASDGTLTHQGQRVTRARLEGKEFKGDVAGIIRDLPAGIVDKIQIVDDYADLPAGKDRNPQRVLNILVKR